MPTPRQILDLLTREELAHLVQQHGINLGGRARAHTLDRLEEKGPGLAGLLSGLLRPRLVDLCAQLGLSDGSKDKGALVARLCLSASASRDVILPMTVLRRLDSLLEPTKAAVLNLKASLDKAKIINQDGALRQAAGQPMPSKASRSSISSFSRR